MRVKRKLRKIQPTAVTAFYVKVCVNCVCSCAMDVVCMCIVWVFV